MKIAYFAHWAESATSGVISKIQAQTTCWRDEGHEVGLFLLVPNRIRRPIAQRFAGYRTLRIVSYRHRLARPVRTAELYARIVRWNPDIAYGRRMLYHPAYHYLTSRTPVIVEVNTNDVNELKVGKRHRRWYNQLTRDRGFAAGAAMVYVTEELSVDPAFTRYGKPTCVIANGIDLDSMRPLEPAKNPVPHIVFMGTKGQHWHGVDKIVTLAGQLPQWHFDLIGMKAIDVDAHAPSNLTFHGRLDKDAYLAVLAGCDVAIGSLAMHRIDMGEACPLKVREYLACGIPTIIAYRETDFPDPVEYLLELPNVEQNLDVDAIREFAQVWRGRRLSRKDIRHIDVRAKEKKRLDFMLRCLRPEKTFDADT